MFVLTQLPQATQLPGTSSETDLVCRESSPHPAKPGSSGGGERRRSTCARPQQQQRMIEEPPNPAHLKLKAATAVATVALAAGLLLFDWDAQTGHQTVFSSVRPTVKSALNRLYGRGGTEAQQQQQRQQQGGSVSSGGPGS